MQFTGRIFMDIYRAFQSRSVSIIGIYRAASKGTQSTLPYVYTNPTYDVLMSSGDILFAIGHPTNINDCIEEFKNPIVRYPNGNLGLASSIQAAITGPFKHARSVKILNFFLERNDKKTEVLTQANMNLGRRLLSPTYLQKEEEKLALSKEATSKIIIIQKLYRGFMARKIYKIKAYEKLRANAAAKIQARIRGAVTRKRVNVKPKRRKYSITRKKNDEVCVFSPIDEDSFSGKKSSEKNDPNLNEEDKSDRKKAADKIQRLFKMHKIRQEEKKALGDASSVNIKKNYDHFKTKHVHNHKYHPSK